MDSVLDREEIKQESLRLRERIAGDVQVFLEEHGEAPAAVALYTLFMEVLGLSVSSEDTKDTPFRVSKMFIQDFTRPLVEAPPAVQVFPNEGYDEYILIKGIDYTSLCSHHHMPFSGKVSIVYHPGEYLAGLSKFARVVEYFAAFPQIQEGFTQAVIEYLFAMLKPVGIYVHVTGAHTCMTGRGAKNINSSAVTVAIRGKIDKVECQGLVEATNAR